MRERKEKKERKKERKKGKKQQARARVSAFVGSFVYSRAFQRIPSETHLEIIGTSGHFTDELLVGKDAESFGGAIMFDAFSAHLQPIRRGEVDRLGEIVALEREGEGKEAEETDEFGKQAALELYSVYSHRDVDQSIENTVQYERENQ